MEYRSVIIGTLLKYQFW